MFGKRHGASYCDDRLPCSESLKVLGVVFHESTGWKCHTKFIAKKAARRIHILKSARKIPSVTKHDLLPIYHHLIFSVLKYNCPLMVGMSVTDSSLLERIRRRCHRIICGSECVSECLPSIADRGTSKALKLFCSCLNPSHVLHKFVPRQLRYSRKLLSPLCRTKKRAQAFFSILHSPIQQELVSLACKKVFLRFLTSVD